ncbi:Slp1p [Rhodotorula paludigena]|uniref:Slp1p n=1 Tax=Rhodotorula paludigena TaxID=86838 RepID=UPI00317E9F34
MLPRHDTTSAAVSPASDSAAAAPSAAPPDPSPSPTAAEELLPPPPPAVPEELALTELPPAPELLSFNEWRERYVVHPDPSVARRAKKAAQRARHGEVGAEDGAEIVSGGTRKEEARSAVGQGALDPVGGVAGAGDAFAGAVDAQIILADEDDALAYAVPSDSGSPIQPLPNVGAGDSTDPLVLLKDRSNYAASECAAKLHRSSRQSKGASAILNEKKDRYMLTPCAASPKFVDVELCDEIQIDTLVLANFEFFSSTFKHFKASCSVDYPGKPDDWHDLGTFRARNVRGLQVFRPLRDPHFCRYLRIDFLSHFGSEYYCPVSLLRAYGFTQLDAYRESERKAKAIEAALRAAEMIEDEVDEQERALEDALKVEVEKLERLEPSPEALNSTSATGETSAQVATGAETSTTSSTSSGSTIPTSPGTAAPLSTETSAESAALTGASASTEVPHLSSVTSAASSSAVVEPTSKSSLSSASPTVSSLSSTIHSVNSTLSSSPPANTSAPASGPSLSLQAETPATAPTKSSAETTVADGSHSATSASKASSASTSSIPSPSAATVSSETSSALASQAPPTTPSAPRNETVQASSTHSTPTASASHAPAPAPPPLPPPPPRAPVLAPPIAQPQPGESIYGTIMKRLSSLEHNQTITLGFIEAQSGMLREAFGRVERRLSDVEMSRSRQEQSIRQALHDLEKQRLELERERLALISQVNLLAQEIRFEKRLTVAQLVGLLLLVIFVGFTRGIPTSPFLHLASAQAGRYALAKREREKEREAKRTADAGEASGKAVAAPAAAPIKPSDDPVDMEAPRRTQRVSPATSLSRQSSHAAHSSKRYPSLSKPGTLRRHYGVGAPSSSSIAGGGSASRSSRTTRAWTPPVRHSSAPPEDPLPDRVTNAIEAREAARRRVHARGASVRTVEGAPLAGSSRLAPPRPSSAFGASSADDADTEPSDVLGMAHGGAAYSDAGAEGGDEADLSPVPSGRGALSGIGALSPLSSAGGFDDEHGYHTYSSDDEVVLPPAPAPPSPPESASSDKGKARAVPPSPSGASSTSASAGSPVAATTGRKTPSRPPKPQVPARPATSMGIRFPSIEGTDGSLRRLGDAASEEQEVLVVQEPRSALPSPPPEPVSRDSPRREE